MLVSWRKTQNVAQILQFFIKLCFFPLPIKHWVGAGRQFIAAEEQLFSARHASYWESLDAGINCFMLAIEVETLAVHLKGGDGRNVLAFNNYDDTALDHTCPGSRQTEE